MNLSSRGEEHFIAKSWALTWVWIPPKKTRMFMIHENASQNNHPWDERYIYLHAWVDIFMVNVGKHTSPMDSHFPDQYFNGKSPAGFLRGSNWRLVYCLETPLIKPLHPLPEATNATKDGRAGAETVPWVIILRFLATTKRVDFRIGRLLLDGYHPYRSN